MKVYLAGGQKSGWQDRVKEYVPNNQYFDPRKDADQRFAYRFVQKDIELLQSSDLVFAYFEVGNPSGLGLAFEIGQAVACNIPVWYIDEHDRMNTFLCACSKRVYSEFNQAVIDLRELK